MIQLLEIILKEKLLKKQPILLIKSTLTWVLWEGLCDFQWNKNKRWSGASRLELATIFKWNHFRICTTSQQFTEMCVAKESHLLSICSHCCHPFLHSRSKQRGSTGRHRLVWWSKELFGKRRNEFKN